MSGKYLHMDISEYLLTKIKRGTYHSGDKLPSENMLCQQFQTNHGIVRRAIKRLVDMGQVVSWQGKGSFVTSQPNPVAYELAPDTGFSHNLSRQGVSYKSRLCRWAKRLPSCEEAGKLSISPDSYVYDLQILRFIQDRPASLSNSIINAVLTPRLPDYLADFSSLYRILERYFHFTPVRRQSTIQALIPGKAEAELLQLPEDVPVVRIESLSYCPDGSPVEITRSKTRSDLCRYIVRF